MRAQGAPLWETEALPIRLNQKNTDYDDGDGDDECGK